MLSRTSRSLLRLSSSSRRPAPTSPPPSTSLSRPLLPLFLLQPQRSQYHNTPVTRKGITPGSSDPTPPNPQPHNQPLNNHHNRLAPRVAEPSPLTDNQYHSYSERYLHAVLAEVERVQEEGADIEAEYSAGVLNIIVPSVGTYVLNKQPPNKQIWLSSPISGPKRYDWVVQGDHAHEKQDTRGFINGQWIYLRDGSNLTDLLNEELTLSLPKDLYSQEE